MLGVRTFYGPGLCSPTFTVEVAVADSLGYVLELYILTCVKVGNGARDLEYAVVC